MNKFNSIYQQFIVEQEPEADKKTDNKEDLKFDATKVMANARKRIVGGDKSKAIQYLKSYYYRYSLPTSDGGNITTANKIKSMITQLGGDVKPDDEISFDKSELETDARAKASDPIEKTELIPWLKGKLAYYDSAKTKNPQAIAAIRSLITRYGGKL